MFGSKTDRYKWVAKNITAGKLLDVGCRNGELASYLDLDVIDYTGIDINPSPVGEVMDATNMSFPDRTFDWVVAVESLEHMDCFAALSEIHRVLKPGGWLVGTLPHCHSFHKMLKTVVPFLKKYRQPGHLTEFQESMLVNLLDSFGFNVITVEESPLLYIPGTHDKLYLKIMWCGQHLYFTAMKSYARIYRGQDKRTKNT